jgi:hypothetical protein
LLLAGLHVDVDVDFNRHKHIDFDLHGDSDQYPLGVSRKK